MTNRLLKRPWDPLKYAHEQPSPQCLLRAKKDIADFYAKPLAGVCIFPEQDNVTNVHALVKGPANTPYAGGLFHFLIKFPQDYPMSPPRIRFMTTDGGRMRFHWNLFASGMVSLSLFGHVAGQLWSPTLGLEDVLVWLQSFFFDTYYEKEYNDFMLQETIRVAVCDTVQAALQECPQYPQVLREHILKSFSESYSEYVGIVSNNLHLTGRAICVFSGRGRVFRYEPLLTRLKELKKMVEEKLGDAGQGNE